MNTRKSSPLFNANQFLLFLLLLFGIMYLGKSLLVPLVFGSMLAMLLAPLTARLEKWRIPRVPAALISVLLIVGIIISVFSVLINQLISLGNDLSKLESNLPKILENVYTLISDTFELTKEQQEEYIRSQLRLATGRITNIATMTLRSLGVYLFNFVIVITYTILMLIYRFRFKDFVAQLVGMRRKEKVVKAIQIVEKATTVASSYIAGVFIVIIILTVANIVALSLIGMEHALFFGLVAGILNLIPYVGMVSGSAIPVIYLLLTQDTLTAPIVTTLYFIAIQNVEAYILTPNITGAKVDLSPLATIFALLLGGFIWGMAGMVVFVPILGIAKVVFDNVEELRPYGYLIGTR